MFTCSNKKCEYNRTVCAIMFEMERKNPNICESCTRMECIYNKNGLCMSSEYRNTKNPGNCNSYMEKCEYIKELE